MQGGLGNQMFEYACAKALSIEMDVPLVFDLTFYSLYKHKKWNWPYQCDIFNIKANTTKVSLTGLLFFLLKKIGCDKIIPSLDDRRVRELYANGTFPKSCIIDAYMQSPYMFEKYRQMLLNDFTFKGQMDDRNYSVAKEISSCNSVSIHIRRGDYLNQGYLAVQELDYYRKAMNYIQERENEITYYIFSDDLQWCKENFDNEYNLYYVDVNSHGKAYNDMRLMSLCKHNIIANSSFSWWAAWLNTNNDKIVIAPKNYCCSQEANDSKLSKIIPNDWILI